MELTGVPIEYRNFKNLVDLDLSYNLLHGSMPPELGEGNWTSKLKRFFLSSNRFNGTVPESYSNLTALEHFTFDLNIGMCSDTVAPFMPEIIGVLPGTLLPRVCPISKGPENVQHDDVNAFDGRNISRDDPYNFRHPLDRGVDTVTYCGPHADPQPVSCCCYPMISDHNPDPDPNPHPKVPCVYETLVPPAVRARVASGALNISWLYPAQGTLAVRDGVPNLKEMTRYERREHREAGYPFEYLPLKDSNGNLIEFHDLSGLDGLVNMWNDNQHPKGFRVN